MRSDPGALSPRLVHRLRTVVPRGAVVLAPVQTSYRVTADAPVYVVALPVPHVANTKANDPYTRVRLVRHWVLTNDGAVARRYGATWAIREGPPLSSTEVKVLLVTMYFPPAGGGGVQRPLKFATHLPSLGIETHVLAPDDPKWIHRDDELQPPTLAWVHRARYLGPKGRKPAEELHGTQGLERVGVHARLAGRRLLVPDENVSWNLTAIPTAIRIVKREGIDVVITTSPPSSVHLVGAAVKRATGIPWVADLRDSMVAHPHRHAERMLVRAKEQGEHAVARARRAQCERDRHRLRGDHRRGARTLTARAGRDDRERLGLRRLRRSRVPAVGALPDHACGLLLRQARPAAVPDRARSVRARRCRRPLPRRLSFDRPRVGGRSGARRPARADPVRSPTPLARAAA